MEDLSMLNVVVVLLIVFAMLLIWHGVKVVPQSRVYVVERFGKYQRTLPAGLSVIVPFLDSVSHRISVLERQLPEFTISVITRDNVEVNLQSKAGEWGLEITSTAITDVVVDEVTKTAQRQQLNAERERRAAIARAEGDKRAVELAAEAKLFEAQKEAEALRLTADAEAYAVRVKADAEQTDSAGCPGDCRRRPAGNRLRSAQATGRRSRPTRIVAELQDSRRSHGCDRGHRSPARDRREHGEASQ